MKNIKSYKLFESSSSELTQAQKEFLRWHTLGVGQWKFNPETNLVDITGSFVNNGTGSTDFRGISFGNVTGNFYVGNNQITSLKGSPRIVGGNFSCYNNNLTSLEGSPEVVKGGFDCHSNYLTDLVGAPTEIGANFICEDNLLTNLVGCPKNIGGDLNCTENEIVSMEGAPQKLDGSLYCRDNPVKPLTLRYIFDLMKTGKSYPDALKEYWPSMDVEDKALMYKDMTGLTQEEIKLYEILLRHNKRKAFL